MEIIKKLEKTQESFKDNQQQIEMLQGQIGELLNQQGQLKGRYDTLLELGKEEGVIDENGNVIKKESKD